MVVMALVMVLMVMAVLMMLMPVMLMMLVLVMLEVLEVLMLVMMLLVAVAMLVFMIVLHNCIVLLPQRYCRLSATRLQIRGRKVEMADLQRVTDFKCGKLPHLVFISPYKSTRYILRCEILCF